MKYLFSLFIIFLFFSSCSKEDSCFSNSGKSVFETKELSAFDEIDIPKGVAIEIVESVESKIEISTKENYLNNLDFQIQNKQLIISNFTNCQILHSYQIATIRVYTPTLKKITSRTQFKVTSKGTLHFTELFLLTGIDDGASTFFDLEIDNSVLRIEDSQIGFFKISGKTNWFQIALYGGTGRVDAHLFNAYDCDFFQRSNNDILLNVENRLEGTIFSTGNVIVYNQPKQVNVEQKYKGKLIYK